MVQKSEALALVPALIILCLKLENSNANLCMKTFEASLYQTTQLIMNIKDQAKKLYESYLTHQELRLIEAQLCQRNISWFLKRDIPKKTDRMLQRLHKTLQRMNNSLTVIREQQRDLNHENASLHGELKRAQLSVKGLLHNTKCTLSLLGQTPISIPPPTRHTERNSFVAKIMGCKILWNYWQFISHLSQAFKNRPHSQP